MEERDYLLWMAAQDLADETLLLVKDALAGTVHTRESLAARFAAGGCSTVANGVGGASDGHGPPPGSGSRTEP